MFVLPNGVGGLFRRIGQLISQSSLLSAEVIARRTVVAGRRRRGARRRAARRVRRLGRRSGRQLDDDRHRRDVAAHRPGGLVRVGRARREGVLRLGEREGRRREAEDRLPDRRRRLQPGADRAGGAAARRAGQGVRRLQHARHRGEPRDPRLPEPGQGAAALRRLGRDDVGARRGEVPVDDRLPAELRGRGARLRAVRRADDRRRRRSPSSSRTTTTGRTCSRASSAASAAPARRSSPPSRTR